jgi:exodeoxyribonuclease V
MTWSPQQDAALKSVSGWLKQKGGPQVFRLFGYAGTGKTTLAKEIAAAAGGKVMFGAFTGKAAHVLRKKGCSEAATIHSLIYRFDDETYSGQPTFKLNRDSDVSKASLVIIDEVSMVGEDLGKDLLSFGVPVLVLGDPAQLPPVNGQGFFTDAKPDVMLTEVHRQAEGSPIIQMATTIRTGGDLGIGQYGDCSVIDRGSLRSEDVLGADQVLVGMNRTRHLYNGRIRKLKGFSGETPQKGERLVCLKNNRQMKLLNGSLWDVQGKAKGKLEEGISKLYVLPEEVQGEGKGVKIEVRDEFWSGKEGDLSFEDKRGTQEFTYGYALTTHKAQGSQWDNVMVFDESRSFREDRARWLYTAVTRAAKRLTVVQS